MGQHGVEVAARELGLGHGDIGVVPGIAACHRPDAVLEALVAQIGPPRPGGHHHVHLQPLGGQPHALGPVEDQRPDVAGRQVVGPNHLALGGVDPGLVERHGHLHDARRIEQPPGVLGQPEDGRPALGGVGAHALEYAHAVVQGVGQDVGGGVPPFDEPAIHPDLAVPVGHGHGVRLRCRWRPAVAPAACRRQRSLGYGRFRGARPGAAMRARSSGRAAPARWDPR